MPVAVGLVALLTIFYFVPDIVVVAPAVGAADAAVVADADAAVVAPADAAVVDPADAAADAAVHAVVHVVVQTVVHAVVHAVVHVGAGVVILCYLCSPSLVESLHNSWSVLFRNVAFGLVLPGVSEIFVAVALPMLAVWSSGLDLCLDQFLLLLLLLLLFVG